MFQRASHFALFIFTVCCRFVFFFLGAALIVLMEIGSPQVIVSILDANLAVLKWGTQFFPYPASVRVESILRMLNFEHAMIFAEAAMVCKAPFLILRQTRRFI